MDVENNDSNKLITGSSGKDYITNDGTEVTIDAGDGNDTIGSYGMADSLNGGDGDDRFEVGGWDATVKGGKGNDYVFFGTGYDRHVIEYADGDGDDTIDALYFTPNGISIKIMSGSVSSYEQDGDNFVLHIGSGSLTIKNAYGCRVFDADDNSTIIGYNSIENYTTGKVVEGTSNNDWLYSEARNATLNGNAGNDVIDNNGGTRAVINGGAGNDKIYNQFGSRNTLNGGDGDDFIMNLWEHSNVLINGDAGNDYIENMYGGGNSTTNGGDGDDTIFSYASVAAIDGGAGNDYIEVNGEASTINGGAGDDTININAPESVVKGGAGNDYININSGNNVFVDGGADDDRIETNVENATIRAGKGNDNINLNNNGLHGSNVVEYAKGDGYDVVVGFEENDTFYIIDGSSYSTLKEGSNVVIEVDGGEVILEGAADKNLNIISNNLGLDDGDADIEYNEITNAEDDTKVSGSSNADHIVNTGENVTIQPNGGNDVVEGADDFADLFMFSANDGNNTITNFSGEDSLQIISGTISTLVSGNDLIISAKGTKKTAKITLKGVGNKEFEINNSVLTLNEGQEISSTKDDEKLVGGNGNDYFEVTHQNVTINGGRGDDTIDGSSYGEVIQFGAGEGNDLVINFGKEDTLQITSGTLSTVKSGNDLIVTVKNSTASGTITLGGAGAYKLKSDGEFLTVEDVNYITNTKDNVKVSGTTGIDFITNSGENVTIQPGKGNDTVEGSNHGETFLFSYAAGDNVILNFDKNDTLQCTSGTITAVETIDNDVLVTMTKSKTSGTVLLKNAAKLKFKQSGNYLTVEDVNVIDNTTDKVKVSGTTGNDYISNSAENVTIQPGKGNDTVDGSETFGETFLFSYASGDDVITNFGKGDTLKSTSGNISSVETVNNDVVVTITKSGQSAVGSVTLKNAASLILKQSGNTVTVDDINVIENTTDKKKVTGTTGKDYISNSGENVTIQAGAGDDTIDGSEEFGETYLFSYASGDNVVNNFGTNDTLKCTSGSITAVETVDNDVLITMTKSNTSGTVLLKDAAQYTFKKTGQTLTVETINEVKNSQDNQRLVGTSGKDLIENTGENVTIVGSAGEDTLTGSDTFGELYQFTSLNGGNVITNFGSNDTLQITKGSIYSTVLSDDGNDLIISMGKASTAGTVTLQGVGSYTDLIKKSGKYLIFDDVNMIINQTDKKKVTGKSGRDYIINTGDKATINGAGGNDTIDLSDNPEVVLFGATGGEDLILGFGKSDTLYINSGSISSRERVGDDYIVNVTSGKTIGTITLEGAGIYDFEQDGKMLTVRDVNYIFNHEDNKKVSGSSKADFITNSGDNVTIQPGKGNDTVYGSNHGDLFLFSYAAGDNVILNFDKNDTLQSTSGNITSRETVDNDVVVTIKKGSNVGTVTLKDAASYSFKQTSTVLTVDDVNVIDNDTDNYKVTGTAKRDLISNSAENVTIQPGKGNDTIIGSDLYGDMFLFSYAAGDNVITNFGKNDTLKSTSGTLSVQTVGDDAVVTITKSNASGTVTLEGAGAYDFNVNNNTLTVNQIIPIENDRDGIKVTGTSGDDYIINTGENVSIQPGKGNDTIDGSVFGEVFMFSYAAGDNVITNFGANDTLRNTSGTMSYEVSGDDVIVSITKSKTTAKVTLQGAGVYGDLIKKTNTALYVDGLNAIENTEDNKKVTGTAGRDYIANTGENVTIQAGAGDDIITGSDLFGERFLFSYASGDDTITNFSLGDTIQSTSGTLTYKTSGNDYIVTITKSGQSEVGTVTLTDAAEDYTLIKSGSNLIASAKASANVPEEGYWFLNEEVAESPLSSIVETESAIDLPDDFINDALNRKENLLTYSARSHRK